MFELQADKTGLRVCARETVTSGSVNVYQVQFQFSDAWDGLERTAVFRAGPVCRSVLLDGEGACAIPWEVLEHHGPRLECGVYGTSGGEIVLPTVWADLGLILEGAAPGTGENARPPTPELWEQELAKKADGMNLDGLTLELMSGEKVLSQVELPPPGGGEGGVSDHRLLRHRDAERQHPVSAIDGLAEELRKIPRPMTADELRKILMKETDR